MKKTKGKKTVLSPMARAILKDMAKTRRQRLKEFKALENKSLERESMKDMIIRQDVFSKIPLEILEQILIRTTTYTTGKQALSPLNIMENGGKLAEISKLALVNRQFRDASQSILFSEMAESLTTPIVKALESCKSSRQKARLCKFVKHLQLSDNVPSRLDGLTNWIAPNIQRLTIDKSIRNIRVVFQSLSSKCKTIRIDMNNLNRFLDHVFPKIGSINATIEISNQTLNLFTHIPSISQVLQFKVIGSKHVKHAETLDQLYQMLQGGELERLTDWTFLNQKFPNLTFLLESHLLSNKNLKQVSFGCNFTRDEMCQFRPQVYAMNCMDESVKEFPLLSQIVPVNPEVLTGIVNPLRFVPSRLLYGLLNLKKLVKLDLSGQVLVSDRFLWKLGQSLPNLEELSLQRCRGFGNRGLQLLLFDHVQPVERLIPTMALNFLKLSVLRLDGTRLTDQAFTILASFVKERFFETDNFVKLITMVGTDVTLRGLVYFFTFKGPNNKIQVDIQDLIQSYQVMQRIELLNVLHRHGVDAFFEDLPNDPFQDFIERRRQEIFDEAKERRGNVVDWQIPGLFDIDDEFMISC